MVDRRVNEIDARGNLQEGSPILPAMWNLYAGRHGQRGDGARGNGKGLRRREALRVVWRLAVRGTAPFSTLWKTLLEQRDVSAAARRTAGAHSKQWPKRSRRAPRRGGRDHLPADEGMSRSSPKVWAAIVVHRIGEILCRKGQR